MGVTQKYELGVSFRRYGRNKAAVWINHTTEQPAFSLKGTLFWEPLYLVRAHFRRSLTRKLAAVLVWLAFVESSTAPSYEKSRYRNQQKADTETNKVLLTMFCISS